MSTNTELDLPDVASMSPIAQKVALDVGGRKFITLASTLEESRFLSALVSGRWDHNKQEDGSFFIDADPGLFQYILEYLRRQRMPLFWDRENGHDLGRYKSLLQEAEYFDIPQLSRWLSDQEYMDAVTITTTITHCTIPDRKNPISFPGSKSVGRRNVETLWQEEDIFVCLKNPDHNVPDDCDYHGCVYPDASGLESYPAKPEGKYALRKQMVLKATVVDESVAINSQVFRPVSGSYGRSNWPMS